MRSVSLFRQRRTLFKPRTDAARPSQQGKGFYIQHRFAKGHAFLLQSVPDRFNFIIYCEFLLWAHASGQ
jgi:hypothetical protein